MKTFGLYIIDTFFFWHDLLGTNSGNRIYSRMHFNQFQNQSCPYRSWLDPQLPVQLPFFPGPPWHPSPQTCHQTSGTAAQRKPAARHDVESGTLQWTQRRILTKCRAPWNSSCGSPRSWSPLFVRQFHEQQPKTPGPRRKHCSWHRVLLEYLYIESIVSKARGRHEWENWRI